jgi:hypothetical protein
VRLAPDVGVRPCRRQRTSEWPRERVHKTARDAQEDLAAYRLVVPQMHRPWPDAREAVAMPVAELALRVVDRLDVTPDDPFHSLFRRDAFVNREVTEHESRRRHLDGAATMTTSGEALARHPALARAYGEAWDYAVGQGWLAADPVRSGFVYVTQRGQDALSRYRETGPEGATPAVAQEGLVEGERTEQTVSATDVLPYEGARVAASPRRVRRVLYNPWTVGVGTAATYHRVPASISRSSSGDTIG